MHGPPALTPGAPGNTTRTRSCLSAGQLSKRERRVLFSMCFRGLSSAVAARDLADNYDELVPVKTETRRSRRVERGRSDSRHHLQEDPSSAVANCSGRPRANRNATGPPCRPSTRLQGWKCCTAPTNWHAIRPNAALVSKSAYGPCGTLGCLEILRRECEVDVHTANNRVGAPAQPKRVLDLAAGLNYHRTTLEQVQDQPPVRDTHACDAIQGFRDAFEMAARGETRFRTEADRYCEQKLAAAPVRQITSDRGRCPMNAREGAPARRSWWVLP